MPGSIEVTWTDGTKTGTYKAIVSPDLAVPIYLEIGSADEEEDFDDDIFVYELTGLTLK